MKNGSEKILALVHGIRYSRLLECFNAFFQKLGNARLGVERIFPKQNLDEEIYNAENNGDSISSCLSHQDVIGVWRNHPLFRRILTLKYVVTWPNYDGDFEVRYEAIYCLNGIALGKGDEEFERLPEEVAHFQVGNIIILDYEPMDATGGKSGYAVPYALRKNEFYRVAKERKLIVTYPTNSDFQ